MGSISMDSHPSVLFQMMHPNFGGTPKKVLASCWRSFQPTPKRIPGFSGKVRIGFRLLKPRFGAIGLATPCELSPYSFLGGDAFRFIPRTPVHSLRISEGLELLKVTRRPSSSSYGQAPEKGTIPQSQSISAPT